MKTVDIKSLSEIKLKGITADGTIVNGNVKEVRLIDDEGNVLVCRESGYSMSVSIKAPPVTETRYEVVGKVLGVEVRKEFDCPSEAASFQSAMIEKAEDEVTINKFEKVIED